MSVGATVSDGVKTAYDELRTDKKHRYVFYKFNEEHVIEMDTTGERSATVADFVEKLRQSYADQCRWAVFDYTMAREDGTAMDKKVFISWFPEKANVRQQMIYKSTKDTLRRQLIGISTEIEVPNVEEVENRMKTAVLR